MERITGLTGLLESQLGVKTHPEVNPLSNVVGVTATRIVPNNDNRVGLNFVNNGAFPAYIWTDNSVSSGVGFLVSNGGGFLGLDWRDDLSLVSNEWWAIGIGGATTINTLGLVTL